MRDAGRRGRASFRAHGDASARSWTAYAVGKPRDVLVLHDACRSVRVTRFRAKDRRACRGGETDQVQPKRRCRHRRPRAARNRERDGTGKTDGRNGFYTHHLLKYLAEKASPRHARRPSAIVRESDGKTTAGHWWMGSKRVERIQLAGGRVGSNGPDMVEPEIVSNPGRWNRTRTKNKLVRA